MISQWAKKKYKILKGVFNSSYLELPNSWWNTEFYLTSSVNDAKTLSNTKNVITANYHYASTEVLISRYLRNTDFNPSGKLVLDLGSGAGHWIDFYINSGYDSIEGVEISELAYQALIDKYGAMENITLQHDDIHHHLVSTSRRYDVINAIGIMFHITNDESWRELIKSIYHCLLPGGLFIASGHFGLFPSSNVQIEGPYINKRLRSRRAWNKELKKAGFTDITFIRNPAYLYINDTLPENNLVIARRL
jgi:SAM-dependent methyltransferase